MFHRGDLPLTLARVLLLVSDPVRQRQVATMAARRSLTVPELERIVERGAGALRAPPPRASLPPDEPVKRGLSPSRVAALSKLEQRPDDSVSLGEIAELFRSTCCACGMEDLPTYCSGCPMLELVDRLLIAHQHGRGPHDC
jgi:hypothetical protein